MTTITIERELLEQALNALLLPCDRWNKQQFLIVKGAIEALNAALAAPATAPEKTVKEIMEFVRHYAANTFSSATLEDKIRRSLETPATAPEPVAWLAHYVGRSGMEQEYVSTDKNLADQNDASGKSLPLYLHPPSTAPAHTEAEVQELLRGDWQLSADEFEEKLRRILGVPTP